MVVMDLPATALRGNTQERVGAPSMCTVQAPHSAMPQPNFVPVMPNTSRNTQRSGVSPSTSTVCDVPLTLTVKAMASHSLFGGVDTLDRLDQPKVKANAS